MIIEEEASLVLYMVTRHPRYDRVVSLLSRALVIEHGDYKERSFIDVCTRTSLRLSDYWIQAAEADVLIPLGFSMAPDILTFC